MHKNHLRERTYEQYFPTPKNVKVVNRFKGEIVDSIGVRYVDLVREFGVFGFKNLTKEQLSFLVSLKGVMKVITVPQHSKDTNKPKARALIVPDGTKIADLLENLGYVKDGTYSKEGLEDVDFVLARTYDIQSVLDERLADMAVDSKGIVGIDLGDSVTLYYV